MSAQNSDVGGNGHRHALHFRHVPQRVISLVPSLTESMWDLGFGEALVGITDYCVHPADRLQHVPRLGGTKNPRVDEIISLKPDLVLANMEENTRKVVEALESAGIAVWVTFPQTVRQALDVLWALVGLFRSREAALRLETLERTYEWACAAARGKTVRVFCPIWMNEGAPEWYMTFNQRTYCHDLLASLGGWNVFAERERRYPLEAEFAPHLAEEAAGRDTRYPRVTLDEVRMAEPEVIFLPDEPFAFNETHKRHIESMLTQTPAVMQHRVYLVEGSLITWHGTRLSRALQVLPQLLDVESAV